MMEHTGLVNEAREKLSCTVYTEDQNSFRFRGATATLTGKPDMIAVKGKTM